MRWSTDSPTALSKAWASGIDVTKGENDLEIKLSIDRAEALRPVYVAGTRFIFFVYGFLVGAWGEEGE